MATQKDNSNDTTTQPEQDAWQGFNPGRWQTEIDVQNFIQTNYTPYEGDSAFLSDATDRTTSIWARVMELIKEELKKGVLDVANDVGSSITAHGPGYIDQDKDVIVGLQTDAPLKRAIFPFAGARPDRRCRKCRGGGRFSGHACQRGTGGNPAFSQNGRTQVGSFEP